MSEEKGWKELASEQSFRIVELEEQLEVSRELSKSWMDNFKISEKNLKDLSENSRDKLSCKDDRIHSLEAEVNEMKDSLKSRFNDWLLRGGQIKSLEADKKMLIAACDSYRERIKSLESKAEQAEKRVKELEKEGTECTCDDVEGNPACIHCS